MDTNRYVHVESRGRCKTPIEDMEVYDRLVHDTFGIDRAVAEEAVAFVTSVERGEKTRELAEQNRRLSQKRS